MFCLPVYKLSVSLSLQGGHDKKSLLLVRWMAVTLKEEEEAKLQERNSEAHSKRERRSGKKANKHKENTEQTRQI